MKLKLIGACLCAAMLAGCETANQGVVLCRNSEIERSAAGTILSHPFSTKQTKYKAGEVPTLFLYGYGGKHVRIEIVNAAGQIIDHAESDVPTPLIAAEKNAEATEARLASSGYYDGSMILIDRHNLRDVAIVHELNIPETGTYEARLLVNGQLAQTVNFEVEW